MIRLRTLLTVCLLIAMLISLAHYAPALPQQTGAVAGKVVDELTGNPLTGATISVQKIARSAETNRTGGYQILRLPAGRLTMEISYLGYEPASIEVEVRAGETASVEVKLKPLPILKESVTVEAEPILEGQAKALNQQKSALNIINVISADQIGRFPDPNAAEAAQRIPGITIQRDQGEGRYVLVRGTEPRFNSMMINGERIPSPEGDIRNVALDVIPADLLEAIEVSKALIPDMDADSIGGSVNLVTKQPPEKTRFSLTLGAGYNEIVRDALEIINGSFGRGFRDNRVGLSLSGSYLNTDRGSQNFEPSYDDGFLDALELRDYRINRKRYGFNGDLAFRPSNNSSFFLRGIFNQFDDQEFRRTVSNDVSGGSIERHLKDRFESQQIYSFSAGGKHLLRNLFQLDYRLAYSYAEEEEPDRLDSAFVQEDVTFAPNVLPSRIDPRNIQANPLNQNISEFRLDSLVSENNLTTERDFVASINFAMPFSAAGRSGGLFKAGGKYRHKKKDRNNEAVEFESEADLFLTQFLDRSYKQRRFLDGRYRPGGQFQDPNAARNILSDFDLEGEKDREGDAADFEATEKIGAGYVMAEIYLGEKFTLLPGIRYEHTRIDYTGFNALFNRDGDFAGITPVTGENSYGQFFPALHARYRLSSNSVLRAAFTRTLARPNYIDLVPFQLILEEDGEIVRGNPNLDSTTSWNFDLMGERYFSNIGIVSAGMFYKRLRDNIFLSQFDEIRNGQRFDVFQPINGESGRLLGVEIALQNQLRFLPAPFDGFGIYANYTYVDSSARLSDREIRLPGQSEHSGNFSVYYEKHGFSGRVSLNYHGRYIEAVGGEAASDIFFDNHSQWDFSASQRITRRLRVFAEVINFTNEPLRRFEGFRNRPLQEEYYSWWATAGVKIDF